MNTSSEIIGTQIKAMGQTPEEANALLFNLVGVSQALGRPASEMLKDFKSSMPILARFETEMQQKIFKDTAFMAAKLGIEVNTLLQMNENMDTFEGAAKFAQEINVAFGAPIVSAQALLAAEGPMEKSKIIRDSIQGAGKSIKDLGALQQRALAQSPSLGFSGDVTKLQQFFDGETQIMGEGRESLDNVATNMMGTQDMIAQNLSQSTKIAAKMEQVITDLVNAIDGENGLITLTNKIVQIINFFANNLDAFAGIMLAMALGKFGASAGVVGTVAALSLGKGVFSSTQGDIGEREKERMQQDQAGSMEGANQRAAGGTPPTPDQSSNLENEMKKSFGGQGFNPGSSGATGSTNVKMPKSPNGTASVQTSYNVVGTSQAVTEEDSYGQPGMQTPVMASPNVAKNYVTPVFSKDDHFYAAKSDGALANMIREITGIVAEIADKNQNLKLSMSERETGMMVLQGLNSVKRF
jgi:hypothetical protein